jgi:hypothetical protein
MAVMIEPRNDDRSDALAVQVASLGVRVDEGFKQIDKRFEKVDAELSEQRQEMNEQRQEVKHGFESVHRMIIQAAVGVLTAFIVGFGTLVAVIATQL